MPGLYSCKKKISLALQHPSFTTLHYHEWIDIHLYYVTYTSNYKKRHYIDFSVSSNQLYDRQKYLYNIWIYQIFLLNNQHLIFTLCLIRDWIIICPNWWEKDGENKTQGNYRFIQSTTKQGSVKTFKLFINPFPVDWESSQIDFNLQLISL